MRLGFFAYPWDMLEQGPEIAVEAMATRYHCDSIALNTNYHHARLLRPRATGPKAWQLPGAVAAFTPGTDCYRPGGLIPAVDRRLAESNVLARVRAACEQHSMDLGLWTVGLHNSTLGEQNPQFCVQNCFGDTYTYALCPSHRPVQRYLENLIQDLCQQFQPQRIIQEAIGYLSLRHWVHHELFMTAWDESLELLFSLCFCPTCAEKGLHTGVDMETLRQRVAHWSEWLLHQERGVLPLDFSHGEVASLLMEIPGLWDYVQLRSRTVTALVSELGAIAHEHGATLDLIPASFHRPVSRAWLEGASLGTLGTASDGLLIAAYFNTPGEVAADLRWAAQLAPGVPISAGLNACAPSTRDGAGLASQVAACRAAGCQAVYYYNYGLLTRPRLEWVTQANARMRTDETF
jgi:hypothetical protein